jgi:uncharacterized protein
VIWGTNGAKSDPPPNSQLFVQIPVSHGFLEAILREVPEPVRGAAVVCHPHPLHGGTLHTKAVFRAAKALNEVGLHTLRFNFRGVGTSTGSYGEGVGEQEDLAAALDWLSDRYPALPLVVGGFSFGSMVGLRRGVGDPRVVALLGMGIPIRMYDFSFLGDLDQPLLIVQGEEDEFGRGSEVAETLGELADPIEVVRIPQAAHYFHDHFDELMDAIRTYFDAGPGVQALAKHRPEGR